MQRTPPNALPSLPTLVSILVAVTIMWVARELVIPLALAGLLGFLLRPLAERLEKAGLNRLLAVGVVTLAALAPVAAVAWVAGSELLRLVDTLPQYEGNIRQKLESLEGPSGRMFSRISEMLRSVHGTAMAQQQPAGAPEPVPVNVISTPRTTWGVFAEFGGPVLRPLAQTGIVLVFLVFILVQWEDLRDRVVRLLSGASASRISATTSALNEVTDRTGRFLRTQFLINAGVGTVIGLGLWALGVPSAFLWGLFAAAFKYIPYVGMVVAGSLPFALTLATAQGWGKPVEVVALFVVVEVINGNFVEPYVYGNTTGISSMALLVAAIFWAWLWGIAGLLLATPLTVCLVVAGRYVPRLSFLSILLGDEPVLPPPEKVYQRLVAMDVEEAEEAAEEYLKEHTLAETYDDLLIPALRQADAEREEGKLDQERQEFVHQAVRDMIEDLARRAAELEAEKEKAASTTGSAHQAAPPGPPPGRAAGLGERGHRAPARPRLRVLCIPARDESDALAGSMVQSAMGDSRSAGGHQGLVDVRALTPEDMGTDLGAIVKEYTPDVVLISAVPPHAGHDCRVRAKQVRRKEPARLHPPQVAGLWGLGPSGDTGNGQRQVRERMKGAGFEGVVGSVSEALTYLTDRAPKTEAGHGMHGR
jgi:predicted PurR-regulated permease PerM